MSQTVRKSPQTIGPTMNPIRPKRNSPPSVPIRMRRSGIFASLPTSIGRRKLSTVPTTAAHHVASKIAVRCCPVTNRMIAAGTHTNAAPIPGIIARIVMIVPYRAAPSIPATQNAMPAKAPWIMPITSVPLTVARVIDASWVSIRVSSSSLSGV